MKTKNNVQKTTFKIAAVTVSFVLISLTVSAQELWRELISNDYIQEIAFAMVEHPKEYDFITAEKNLNYSEYSDFIEEYNEESLELEDWMIDETYFLGTVVNLELEIENPLELEEWMLDNCIWKIN